MPQLDIVSFFSQYIWTTAIFFITFFILSKYFLPTLARTLLFREKIYSAERNSTKTSSGDFLKNNTFSSQNSPLWKHGEKLLDEIPTLDKGEDSFKKKGLQIIQNKKESILRNITDSTQFYWSFSKKNKQCFLLNTIFLYK